MHSRVYSGVWNAYAIAFYRRSFCGGRRRAQPAVEDACAVIAPTCRFYDMNSLARCLSTRIISFVLYAVRWGDHVCVCVCVGPKPKSAETAQ